MGESRGGEGGARRATTSDVVRLLADTLSSEDRDPGEIRVQRVTGGLYAVHLTVHGEPEPESFFITLITATETLQNPTPSGGASEVSDSG